MNGQNLFMLQRLIGMVKMRKDDLFVAFGDMEKTYYDRGEQEETV